MDEQQEEQHQSTHHYAPPPITTPLTMAMMTPPPTPPAVRHVLSFSSSMSPPHTPNRQRQVGWWQQSVVRRSSSAVDEAVDELTEKSKFLLRKRSSMSTTPRNSTTSTSSGTTSGEALDSTREEDGEDNWEEQPLAAFHREEILAGEVLGEGTFSCVYEVVGFALNPDEKRSSPLRTELATSSSPTRFALKHLKHSLLQDTLQFEQAATDLVMEAKYLHALQHPNILKLHGEPLNGTAAINSGVDGYFLLCDRLSETLAQRMERWREGQDTTSNTVSCKLSYALQIAQALAYLHEQRILFRDLKPSNVGFHQLDYNRIQLFDFGLCRELPPKSKGRPYVHGQDVVFDDPLNMNNSEYSADMGLELEEDLSWKEEEDDNDDEGIEQVFFMSGAGTQIYMAPEVLVHNRYNLKADVYSWAMTVTELLLLEKPLPHYEMDDHIQYVCVEGDRPALEGHPEIPDSLADLLAWAWEADVSKRCTIQQMCEELPLIMTEVQEDTERCCRLSVSTRIVRAAGRFQEYLFSLMGRALDRVSSFLFRRGTTTSSSTERSSNSTRDVTFDLPQDNNKESQSQPEDPTSTSNGDNSNSDDCVLLSPRPAPRIFRNALLKRKPSSASTTTAMTDDEFDDDYLTDMGLNLPLSPTYSKPPMEALVERHHTGGSCASTSTAAA